MAGASIAFFWLPREAFTVTFQSLSNEAPQHLPTVVAEGGGAVGVDHQGVRTDPDLGHRG